MHALQWIAAGEGKTREELVDELRERNERVGTAAVR
jgi:hypothetical protein